MSPYQNIWGGTVSGTSLNPKNTAGINIFAANTSFRRKPAERGRKIDENQSLHYKPRNCPQVSSGFAGGGSKWAGTARLGPPDRRTLSIQQADLPPGQAENDP
jgi:hypothetical protein